VLLAGEASLFLEGLRGVLRRELGIKVVGVARDWAALVKRALRPPPHVLVLQADSLRQVAADQARSLADGLPGTKVLLVSRVRPNDCVSCFAASGAHGCVPWSADPGDLLRALRALRDGDDKGFFCHCAVTGQAPGLSVLLKGPRTRGLPARNAWELTRRETEVLALIARGLCNVGVSKELGIGVRTVETYRMRLMRRLGIRSVAGLTRYAAAVGLVPF
jgi:DNA-binding NarL/FixJ family response regulator